jgi:hypothetical protein
MRRELRAIQEMAAPGIGERGGADQVDRALPAAQQLQVNRQPFQRFT